MDAKPLRYIMWAEPFCLVALFLGASVADLNTNSFPVNFKFGLATSAFQIEGGWEEDGKGPSVWDKYIHDDPDVIQDKSNADIACDSYHRYEEDVALLKEVGAQFYRFSISWPRILPYGTSQKVNQKGVDYYINLLKLLKENDIEPIVTLYHWDLPLPLQELGGWGNPDIVEYFGEYARLCYQYFGEYVKYWVTLNEPQSSCFIGYGGIRNQWYPDGAPGYHLEAEGVYLCAYTHVKAHALAYHIYQDEFKEKQKGKVSLSLVCAWYEPASNSTDDLLAVELGLQFWIGLFAHPIFAGNWPQLVIDRVGNRSAMEGLPQSRLPTFTQEEIDYINGTYDWYGANYYSTYLARLVYREDDLPGNASYLIDQGFESYANPAWKTSNTSSWLTQVPWGLTKALKWIHENYNQPEIIITENGWSEDGSTLNDTDRIEYVSLHLSSILDAIYDYNINVTGYTQWSLLDNFEWNNGYTAKLGTVSVDFNNENRTRTPKESFYWYQNVISTRCLTDMCSDARSVTAQMFVLYLCVTVSLVMTLVFDKVLN